MYLRHANELEVALCVDCYSVKKRTTVWMDHNITILKATVIRSFLNSIAKSFLSHPVRTVVSKLSPTVPPSLCSLQGEALLNGFPISFKRSGTRPCESGLSRYRGHRWESHSSSCLTIRKPLNRVGLITTGSGVTLGKRGLRLFAPGIC